MSIGGYFGAGYFGGTYFGATVIGQPGSGRVIPPTRARWGRHPVKAKVHRPTRAVVTATHARAVMPVMRPVRASTVQHQTRLVVRDRPTRITKPHRDRATTKQHRTAVTWVARPAHARMPAQRPLRASVKSHVARVHVTSRSQGVLTKRTTRATMPPRRPVRARTVHNRARASLYGYIN